MKKKKHLILLMNTEDLIKQILKLCIKTFPQIAVIGNTVKELLFPFFVGFSATLLFIFFAYNLGR